jgi:hypothetical protein
MFAARDEATKALAQLAYTHYLIPIPNDLDYIATPDEVGRLIREMHEADWLDSARNDYRLGEYEGAGRIKASVRVDELGEAIHRAVAAGRHIVIDLNLRAPAEPAAESFQEIPSGTPLGPEQCWGAQLVLCHRLCTPQRERHFGRSGDGADDRAEAGWLIRKGFTAENVSLDAALDVLPRFERDGPGQ